MARLLEGKKVLVTGVLDRRSIAYSAARLAVEQGAEIALSGGRRASPNAPPSAWETASLPSSSSTSTSQKT